MFVLSSVASILRSVTVSVPRADALDGLDTQVFQARFRVMDDAEAKTFDARRRTMTAEQLADDPHALLREIVIGWDGVVDGDGRPVAFSPEALAAMLALPWAPPALYAAWADGLAGRPRAGN